MDIGGGTTGVCVARVLPATAGRGLAEGQYIGISSPALIGKDDFDLLTEEYLQKDFEQYFDVLLSDLSPDVRVMIRAEPAYWAERVKVELNDDRDEEGQFQMNQYMQELSMR